MIREQQILRGVRAHYEGAPTIKVSVDGGTDSVSIQHLIMLAIEQGS